MPGLRFLANMNISPVTVNHLRAKGWDIQRVSEVMDQSARDSIILDYALKQDRIIITQDLDFSRMLALQGRNKPSVINLRLENPTPEMVTSRVLSVVEALSDELAEGLVVTSDEISIRYRPLPIRID